MPLCIPLPLAKRRCRFIHPLDHNTFRVRLRLLSPGSTTLSAHERMTPVDPVDRPQTGGVGALEQRPCTAGGTLE